MRLALHSEVAAEIAAGAQVDEIVRGLTPLEVAIHQADAAMVELLIRAGADVNHGHPRTGDRPLHDAALLDDLRILELLLDAGADVEGCGVTGTPLCTAAAFGKSPAVRRLLEAGANPDATMGGRTVDELLADFSLEASRIAAIEAEEASRNLDAFAPSLLSMMAEYPTVEEYAAHHGREMFIFGLARGVYSDPTITAWVQALGSILRSPEELARCEERFLSPGKLEESCRREKGIKRRIERANEVEERILRAAEGTS